MAVPESGFRATYVFQVPALPGLGAGVAEFDETRDGFREVLSGARTYYLKSEAPELSTLLSQARHDYIVLDNDSPQELVNEVARHKLVDFWGDLRLLGRPVWGSFVALRTGHRFHHELIRGLSDGYLELIELSEGKVQHDNH